jgi:hypothetical protein
MKTKISYVGHIIIIMITAGMVMFLVRAGADEPLLSMPINSQYETLNVIEGDAMDLPSEPTFLVMKPIDEKPIQLLRPGEGHDRLELSETALEKLAALEEPVSIVGIVGPYHG